FTTTFGNAASRTHAFGRAAAEAVERSREEIARLIHAQSSEIVFTSGATESNNLAIKGVVDFYKTKGNHVITIATEHPAVLDVCRALEQDGRARVTVLPVEEDGLLDLDLLRAAFTSETILVSVMLANNEIGVVQPVREIGRICREKGAFFHSDAAQALGKVPIDLESTEIDLLSLSAHKLYGPKGVGALYVRKRNPRVRLTPQIDGGGHEAGLRSGTLPVPLVAGFAEACRIAGREMTEEANRILALRERLRKLIFETFDHVRLNGSLEHRLPGNLNVSFEYVEGESLILGMADVAVSSGSACASAKLEPSHVLHALGLSEPLARSSIRFGIGRFNTEAEIDQAFALLRREVLRLREISPLYSMARPGENR
ncbi:MAG TPA: aminotransferase class V-fold PLP-dependent enzyme, partial [Planctomycetota bacterium]|nr:aminotransferase class V-fold PLP-dependent enzyme [Planctomycetota bacterium]